MEDVQIDRLEEISDPQELLVFLDIAEPPVDILDVAQKVGLKVSSEFDFNRLSHSGEIEWSDDRGTAEVWVNPTDSNLRRRFTLAHELGHYFKHMLPARQDLEKSERFVDGGRQFRRSAAGCPIEAEANAFAAELLMPENMVRKEAAKIARLHGADGKKLSMTREDFIESLARIFRVSTQAMKWRLVNLGLIAP